MIAQTRAVLGCGLLIVAVTTASGLSADEGREAPAAPSATDVAADAVLAAWRHGGAGALGPLAAPNNPDPWFVAAALCRRGEQEAAMAFARAAVRPGNERLPEYVEARRGKVGDGGALEALARIATIRNTEGAEAALAALPGFPPTDDPLMRYARDLVEGSLLASLGRSADAATSLRRTAANAAAAGWWSGAAAALEFAVQLSMTPESRAEAAEAWLESERARANVTGVVRALGGLGEALTEGGQHARALQRLDEAASVALASGLDAELSRTLRRRATARRGAGDLSGALADAEDAHRRAERGNAPSDMAEALLEVGQVLHARSEAEAATAALERALTSARRAGDRGQESRIQVLLGFVRESVGDLGDARDRHEQALRVAREAGDANAVSAALTGLGNAAYAVGAYEEAERRYREALDVQRKTGALLLASISLQNLGLVAAGRGAYARALDLYGQALAQFESLGARSHTGDLLLAIAGVQRETGQSERALATLGRALEIWQVLGLRVREARTIQDLGKTLSMLGRAEEAAEAFRTAHAILEDLRSTEDTPARNLERGEWATQSGDPEKALVAFRRAAEQYGLAGARVSESHAWSRAALALGALGRTVEADGALERAIALAREAGAASALGQALQVKTVQLLLALRYADCVSTAREVVGLLEAGVAGMDEEHEVAFRAKATGFLDAAVTAAWLGKDVGAVVYFLEVARAGVLRRMLAEGAGDMGPAADGAAAAEESRAKRALALARNRLRRAEDAGQRAEIRAREEELARAQSALLAAAEAQERAAAARGHLSRLPPTDVEALQAALRPDEAIILYHVGFTVLPLAAVVRKGGVDVRPLGRQAETEEALAGLAMEERGTGWRSPARTLRAALVETLALAPDVRRVIVCPEGPLSDVPFSLLFSGKEVVVAPSATTWLALSRQGTAPARRVLGLGDPDYLTARDPRVVELHRGGRRLSPLPATAAEVEAVADVRLLRQEATERRLREALPTETRWRALHFACHGLVDPVRPRLSSLAITPDDDDDGFLTALEILRTRVPADLVTLSACETARGRVVRGEGTLGLARAFLLAGASRVLCSLWKVDDEATRALMERFYALWNPRDGTPGVGVAAALRAAQEHVRSEPRWRHPYYWAAWVLWGVGD